MDNEKRIRARDTTEFLKLIITISISTLIHFPIPDHLPINLRHLASCIDEYGTSADLYDRQIHWLVFKIIMSN